VEGWIEFARGIRDEQDIRTDDRIYVRGDLVLTVVRKSVVASQRIYRWEDHYDQWQVIFDEPPTGMVARLP
jgi:hypothetical protein